MYRIAVQTMDIFACFESIDELGRPLHGAKYRNIISNNIKKTADNALSQATAGGDGCLRLGMAWRRRDGGNRSEAEGSGKIGITW